MDLNSRGEHPAQQEPFSLRSMHNPNSDDPDDLCGEPPWRLFGAAQMEFGDAIFRVLREFGPVQPALLQLVENEPRGPR